MIHTIRTVAVGDQESKIDSPIILYRGDREVEVEFTINGSKFTFTNGGNVIKSTNATHGQLVINTPTGENMFSEVTECHDGKVVFVITKEMIDELIEVGFYSFQIRLFDESQVSRVTIPPVLKGIDIRNPIAAEDETNVVDISLVDYAVVVKDEFEDLSTFLPDGNYNKTEWATKDVISGAKLNKIEDALYNINHNMEATDLALLNRVENINKNVYGEIEKLGNELESEVEEFERSLNVDIEKFKIDINNVLDETKKEFDETKKEFDEEIENITGSIINVKKYGAKGDGKTDDTEAIKNAIEYAEVSKTDRLNQGVLIYFPQGEYVVSGKIKITESGISIKGAGLNTIILDRCMEDSLFEFDGDQNLYRVGLSDLSIISNNYNKNIIKINGAIDSLFESFIIANSFYGIAISDCGRIYFDNIIFTQYNLDAVSNYALTINGGSDLHFTNLQIYANKVSSLPNSIKIQACDGLYFSNSHWHGCVFIEPTDNKTLASVFFDNCYFDRGEMSCLSLSGSSTNPYRNFMFSNCYFRDSRRGIYIDGACELLQFTGCSITQNSSDGVYIGSTVKNIVFSGCSFADNNGSNSVYYADLMLKGGYITVIGCQFVRGGVNGYGVSSDGPYNIIADNNFANSNANKLTVSGSGSSYANNLGVITRKIGSAIIKKGLTEVTVKHDVPNTSSEQIMVIPRGVVNTGFRIAWIDHASFRILINSAETNDVIFTYWVDSNKY